MLHYVCALWAFGLQLMIMRHKSLLRLILYYKLSLIRHCYDNWLLWQCAQCAFLWYLTSLLWSIFWQRKMRIKRLLMRRVFNACISHKFVLCRKFSLNQFWPTTEISGRWLTHLLQLHLYCSRKFGVNLWVWNEQFCAVLFVRNSRKLINVRFFSIHDYIRASCII